MTDQGPFERRLADWMAVTAVAGERTDAVRAAMARTVGVPQRPAWLATNGLGARDGGAPTAGRFRLPTLRLAVLLLVLGLALAGTIAFTAGQPHIVSRADTWTPTGSPSLADMSATVGATVIGLADGRALLIGGYGPSRPTTDVEVWDPRAGTWAPTGSMTRRRAGPVSVVLSDGRVLVVGSNGGSDDPAIGTAEVYDPVSGTFTATGSMVARHEGCHCGGTWAALMRASGVLLHDGRVFVSGGQPQMSSDGSGRLPSNAEIWDPATGIFSATPPIPCGASRGAPVILPDGRVFLTCEGSGSDAGSGPESDGLSITIRRPPSTTPRPTRSTQPRHRPRPTPARPHCCRMVGCCSPGRP